jgi:hypothetical protein
VLESRFTEGIGNCINTGFELSKNKWGVDICLFIIIVITHRRLSIIKNGGGLKLIPQGIPGHLVGELSKQVGGSTPNRPPSRQFKHWINISCLSVKILVCLQQCFIQAFARGACPPGEHFGPLGEHFCPRSHTAEGLIRPFPDPTPPPPLGLQL